MSKPSNRKRQKQRERQERKRRQRLRLPKLTRVERAAKKIDATWEAACDQAEREGFPPEVVYCMRKTGLLLTKEAIDNGEVRPEEVEHWTRSLAEYRAAHPEEQIVDGRGKRITHQTEGGRTNVSVGVTPTSSGSRPARVED